MNDYANEMELNRLRAWKQEAVIILRKVAEIHDRLPEEHKAPLGRLTVDYVEKFVDLALEKGIRERDQRIMIGSMEMMNRTGASYRQLHYWTEHGLIQVENQRPGSGYRQKYSEDDVPKVTLMVQLSNAFGTLCPLPLLQAIYDDFEKGKISLGRGLALVWGARA